MLVGLAQASLCPIKDQMSVFQLKSESRNNHNSTIETKQEIRNMSWNQIKKLRIIQRCDSARYQRAQWVLLLCEGVWRVCLCLKLCYSHQRIKSCLAQLMLLPCRHGAEREPWRAEALQGGDLRAVQGEVCENKCSRAQWELARIWAPISISQRKDQEPAERGANSSGQAGCVSGSTLTSRVVGGGHAWVHQALWG